MLPEGGRAPGFAMSSSRTIFALARHAALLPLALGLSACSVGGAEDGETGGIPDGATLFAEPGLGPTSFACATCHAITEPAADGFRRAGHPVGDAAARPNFKNGQLDDLRDAVNSCVTEWIRGDALAVDDPRWLALRDYLESSAPESASALSYEIVEPPTELMGGDPDAGHELFNQSCALCHGQDALGGEVGPILVQTFQEADYVATRVRLSGSTLSPIYPDLRGGGMPFWAADRISDDEIRDLIAYLQDAYDPGATDTGTTDSGETTDTGTTDTGTTDTGGNCGADHPMVGHIANLETYFHQVSGTAEIIDDCTIEIRDFTYDGTGIDVRIYGGLGGNYVDGFPMTEDLLLPGGYDNDTIYATLPDDKTLDDLDGISVWCIDVAVDFGSGMFGPP